MAAWILAGSTACSGPDSPAPATTHSGGNGSEPAAAGGASAGFTNAGGAPGGGGNAGGTGPSNGAAGSIASNGGTTNAGGFSGAAPSEGGTTNTGGTASAGSTSISVPPVRDAASKVPVSKAPNGYTVESNFPITYVRKDAPPLLVVQGENDNTAPVKDSQRLVTMLTDAGAEASMHLVPGAAHGFDNSTWPDAEKAMFDWLRARGIGN